MKTYKLNEERLKGTLLGKPLDSYLINLIETGVLEELPEPAWKGGTLERIKFDEASDLGVLSYEHFHQIKGWNDYHDKLVAKLKESKHS